jgi:PAS domain S-box-containing protein
MDAERDSVLARYASDVVLIVDAEARVRYLSPSAERLMGYRADEWLGRSGFDAVHPDDFELVAGAFGRALEMPGVNQPVEFRVREALPDRVREWRWFEVVATNLIDHPAILGVVLCARDIHERVEAHEALHRNERRLDAMLANLSDMVSVIDAQGHMTYVSPAARRMFGRNAEDRLGANIFDYVHPDDVANTLDQLRRAREHPGLVDPFDARVAHADGTYRIFEVRANNLLDDPAVQGIIINSRDVTDRVNAEKALHENERLYRTIVETAEEGIWMIDQYATTTFVNRRMAELLEMTPEAVIARPPSDFMDDEGRRVSAKHLELRRAGVSTQFDFKFVRDNGTHFWAMVSVCPLITDDGTYQGSIAMVLDITDRRRVEANLRNAEIERHRNEAEIERHRLEAELDQARRLESLGRLAAGVAHDFNNLLGVILNFARVAARQVDDGTPVADDIAHIQHAAEQATDVTRKLLTFGRADPVNPEVLDLNTRVENITHLVDRSFGRRFAIVTQLAPGGCFVRADAGQIEQLLMNLLVNARDALATGGTITVTTSHEDDGSGVALTVADNGAGMTPDVVKRAFEPFFTTKTAEGGSGLGLATVHAVVERAGGHVTITSELGTGTMVCVRLPRAQ